MDGAVAVHEWAGLTETPDVWGAFPHLSDEQMMALEARGATRPVAPGEVLYRAGDERCAFFVVRSGRVAIVEDLGRENRVLAVHGPRRFLGELSLLTHQPAFLSAVAIEAGEVIVVPAETLRDLVARDALLGDLILRAYLIRRSLLIELGSGLRIIGSSFSPDARRIREFAARNRVPYRWTDLEEDPAAEALLRELGVAPEETPVVICGGTRVLRNPSLEELARVIGLRAPNGVGSACDLIVVGAGPAGLAAAVYGASEGLDTVAFDSVATGGQAATSPQIENYLGFPWGIPGADLADRAVLQAEKFGARLEVPVEVTALEGEGADHVVVLSDGSRLVARTVVIAGGARYRRLDVPRLEEFEGIGVFYAATATEAHFCRRDPVVVVGGGNSAGQASLFLARSSPTVRLIVRHGDLGRDMSRYLVDQIERHPRVEVLLETEARELVGNGALEGVVVEDLRTGEWREIAARALFVFIGAEPRTGWLAGQLGIDEDGYLLTGEAASGHDPVGDWARLGRRPLGLETSRPGIFAAGDIRAGSIKRVASAVGEGAMAVRLVHEYLALAGQASAR